MSRRVGCLHIRIEVDPVRSSHVADVLIKDPASGEWHTVSSQIGETRAEAVVKTFARLVTELLMMDMRSVKDEAAAIGAMVDSKDSHE